MPLLKPVTATVGLFIALGYWNDWFMSNLLLQQLQNTHFSTTCTACLIHRVLQVKAMIGDVSIDIDIPTETTKLAMAVVSTGPILFLYPFVQRYFVTGLVIGSIKG